MDTIELPCINNKKVKFTLAYNKNRSSLYIKDINTDAKVYYRYNDDGDIIQIRFSFDRLFLNYDGIGRLIKIYDLLGSYKVNILCIDDYPAFILYGNKGYSNKLYIDESGSIYEF